MAEFARNRLTPWYVGLAIVAITDLIVGYLFFTNACSAGAATGVASPLLVVIFVILPAVYLALMYITLKSQP